MRLALILALPLLLSGRLAVAAGKTAVGVSTGAARMTARAAGAVVGAIIP